MKEIASDIQRVQAKWISFIEIQYQYFLDHADTLTRIYLFALLGTLFVYLMGMPITHTDTDMWYHLTGGRQTWVTGSVHASAFFSFIEPEKTWTNYFWGFQLVIYGIHSAFGYAGLVVFKAILVTSTAFVISKFILNSHQSEKIRVAQLVILALVVYVVTIRSVGLRPHLVSYFFISTFIYILFSKTKYIPVLPVLTVIWANMHGVEWPVGALICGSYIAQQFLMYKKTDDSRYLKSLPWVLACLPAMLINPYGVNILLAPFAVSSEAYYFINELRETSFSFKGLISADYTITRRGATALLFIFFWVALLGLWVKAKLKFYQVLLAAGALILLFRGQRFVYEWALLSLPIFKAAGERLFVDTYIRHRIIAPLMMVLLLISPIVVWLNGMVKFTDYPFNDAGLPVATTTFIKENNLSGKYVLSPSIAGYIQWELPQVKIHSDMEFPPFDEMDFFELARSYTTQSGLNNMLDKYNPDMFGIRRSNPLFQKLIKEKGYEIVYFDDVLVLYLNKQKYPEIVEKHQLKHIDPFKELSKQSEENLDEKIDELKRLLKIYPGVHGSLVGLSGYLLDAERLDEANEYIQILVDNHPNSLGAFLIQASYHYSLKEYAKSSEYFLKALALRKGNEMFSRYINKNVAHNYYQMDDYVMAYKYFRKSFNPYIYSEALETYYHFAYAAFIADDVEHAQRLCKMLIMLDDGENEELIANAKSLLELIDSGDFEQAFWKI